MEVNLVMFKDGGDHKPFQVRKDVTVVGRREDCDLRIAVVDVSRKHCRLLKSADGVRIEDMGSSNGTFVNGTRVQNADLAPGDTLQIGPVVFVVQMDGEPSLDDVNPQKRPEKSGAAAIDDELDELQILNDSNDSGAVDLIDLDSPKN